MEIRIFDNKKDLSINFTSWLQEILAEKDELFIALSGGSTPKSLFDYWSTLPKNEIDWEKVFFFWGDERCVPPTDDESNYKMTQEHLFQHIRIPEENIFRIRGEEQPENEAHRYNKLLTDHLPLENGTPVFDIVMLGMGDDGHTASIFPHQMDLWDSKEHCVVATHPESGQKRVSLSGSVINAAQHVAFLVTGANKAEKLTEIVNHPQQASEKYPAARVAPSSKNLVWFVDSAAAKSIRAK